MAQTPRPSISPETQIYLTPSHVLEYLYCPRFTYFEHVLSIPEQQGKRLKVIKGREVHKERQKVNPRYLRRKLGVIKREFDVRLASMDHHLSGIVDEVLWLDDGTMAPFDYKYAEDPGSVYNNQRVQSILYGILIAEQFETAVNRGFICFTRSNYKIREVPMGIDDFREAQGLVAETLDIIRSGIFPGATKWKARCDDCCYGNICIR